MAFKNLRAELAELLTDETGNDARLDEGEAYTLAAVRARRAAKQSTQRARARFESKIRRKRTYILKLPPHVRPTPTARVSCVWCRQSFGNKNYLSQHAVDAHPLEHRDALHATTVTAAVARQARRRHSTHR